MFDEFGWIKFLLLNYHVHENLVRAFYSNAIYVEVEDDGHAMFADHITTFVIGRTLVVTKESIMGFGNSFFVQGSIPGSILAKQNVNELSKRV